MIVFHVMTSSDIGDGNSIAILFLKNEHRSARAIRRACCSPRTGEHEKSDSENVCVSSKSHKHEKLHLLHCISRVYVVCMWVASCPIVSHRACVRSLIFSIHAQSPNDHFIGILRFCTKSQTSKSRPAERLAGARGRCHLR